MQENAYDQKHPQTNSKQVLLDDNTNLEAYLKEGTNFRFVDGVLIYKDPATGTDKTLSTSSLANRSVGNVSNLTLESLLNMANIKWEDPKDTTISTSGESVTITTWVGTKVVIKEGSVPRDEKDGTLILDSKVRNQFKTEGLEIQNLQLDKTYHVKLFPYTAEGIVTNDNTNAVTINTKGGKLDTITDITFTPVGGTVFLRFTDPEDKTGTYKGQSYPVAQYAGTKVVIKQGSAPTNHMDGTTVANYTTRNQHSVNSNILKFTVPTEGNWSVTIFNYTSSGVYSVGYSSSAQINFTPLGNVKMLSVANNKLDVTVTWGDPDDVTHFLETEHTVATWAGTKLVRKEGSEPTDENDGVLLIDSTVRNQYLTSGYEDKALVEGVKYYYKLFPYTSEGKVTNSSANSSSITPAIPDDISGAPGPGKLVAGDTTEGYYGVVPPSELISGTALATKVGLTAGTAQFDTEGWLKFNLDGKVLFVAKKNFRHSISWDQLNAAGLVVGSKVIDINGHNYKVRLLRGSVSNPAVTSTNFAIGSEWNRLLLPIHIEAPDKWTMTGNPAPDTGGISKDWGIDFTNRDLNVYIGTGDKGTYSWCQERTTNTNQVVVRGGHGIAPTTIGLTTPASTDQGWRPVLEYIGPAFVDKYGSPGASTTIARSEKEGYFGEVAPTSFIKGSELSTRIGLTAGTAQNDTVGWLKFIIDDKIIFVAKKPFRHSLSWANINTASPIYSEKTVNIDGLTYKVRLMDGIQRPNSSTNNTKGSEWNRLMLPIHINAKTQSWYSAHLVESVVPYWGIDFSNSDLETHYSFGSGAFTLCREMVTENTQNRVNRGFHDVSHASNNPTNSTSTMGWRPVLELVPSTPLEDKSTTPGPKTTIGQTGRDGYFGEVSPQNFISGSDLASQIGLKAGTPQFNTDGWLKFITDGKIIFVAKKPFRHSISWQNLSDSDAIYGSKNVVIGNNVYKVRLMRGALNDPTDHSKEGRDAKGSEWNRLMLPIHSHAKRQSWAYPLFTGNVPDWGIGFTDADLVTNLNYGNGSETWCQEKDVKNPSLYVVTRGRSDVSFTNLASRTINTSTFGWRPVLEYVGPVVEDTFGSPGPSIPVARSEKEGYFGEIAPPNLISGPDLATQLGITGGYAQFNEEGWLKFFIDDKIIFVAKKPFRRSIKWTDISTPNAVYGDRIIKIGNLYYKVRLLKGLLGDNTPQANVMGSEWNRLMLPINIKAKDRSWANPQLVESNSPYWGIDFTDDDLVTKIPVDGVGNGFYTWGQETIKEDSRNRIVRGGTDASGHNSSPTGNYDSYLGWRPVLELVGSEIEDTSGAPGATRTLAHNVTEGYFGEVPSTQLINGTALADQIGLTAGTNQNSDENWLKFFIDGKIVFVAKKPLKNDLAWDDINALNAVTGGKTITIGGMTYKVRLLRGLDGSNTSYTNTKKSEWNRLLLPIHVKAKDKSWSYPAHVDTYAPNWNIGLTDDDLNIGKGTYTWCQETVSQASTARAVRGYDDISAAAYFHQFTKSNMMCWRPVLELVQ